MDERSGVEEGLLAAMFEGFEGGRGVLLDGAGVGVGGEGGEDLGVCYE